MTALRELTQKFDGVTVDNFRVSQEEIDEAHENLDQGVKEASWRQHEH